jgi:diguanylate cyclase (GGDEF)-like protein/PAS domain S-box-containing protein
MIAPPLPADEAERLRALIELGLLDTAAEERFDRITRLASRILDVPIAAVTLIDRDRQWFKSQVGLTVSETPREISFCGHAIDTDDLMIVPDATRDDRFDDNPLVVDEPRIRFYAGRPLKAVSGERVGAFCVIDRAPRELSIDDQLVLEDLAGLVERELQQRTVSAAWDRLAEVQTRYQAIFEHINESISLIQPGEGWIMANNASDRLLGYPAGTTRLDNREAFVHPDDIEAARQAVLDVASGARRGDDPWLLRVRAADDTWHWFESAAVDLRSIDAVGAILVSTRDVTERMRLNELLAHAAGHDPLTDLLNRNAFNRGLDAALARARRSGVPAALLFIDLDRFKDVNDNHGHQVGDEVLCSVADRIRRAVRETDAAARLGGDEFVVICETIDDLDDLRVIADRLLSLLAAPHDTACGPLVCGASIGVALSVPSDGGDQLLARADATLYSAKHAGRGRVAYDADIGD